MTRPHTEYEGIVQVGEVPVVIRRDSPVVMDHDQAFRAGATAALRQVFSFVELAESRSPEYTDLRPYANLKTFLADRLAAVARGEVDGG